MGNDMARITPLPKCSGQVGGAGASTKALLRRRLGRGRPRLGLHPALLNGLPFFHGSLRWLGFIPAAILVIPPALILRLLDFLDRDRNFTLDYISAARKR
jgi:hypothetical protein